MDLHLLPISADTLICDCQRWCYGRRRRLKSDKTWYRHRKYGNDTTGKNNEVRRFKCFAAHNWGKNMESKHLDNTCFLQHTTPHENEDDTTMDVESDGDSESGNPSGIANM